MPMVCVSFYPSPLIINCMLVITAVLLNTPYYATVFIGDTVLVNINMMFIIISWFSPRCVTSLRWYIVSSVPIMQEFVVFFARPDTKLTYPVYHALNRQNYTAQTITQLLISLRKLNLNINYMKYFFVFLLN